ncbi:hypothetical protein B0F90DRAFT_1776798 [Multifurca ochricompacta]|uniref:Secreted protein n=1 Tax=Multifurca ochricompacta TaxID=376703 RepID=A0AAD4QHT1_9AGAM|nr:hypothetical protein B0F90DRAFT_1776798 [Multifurca ochricompacta]
MRGTHTACVMVLVLFRFHQWGDLFETIVLIPPKSAVNSQSKNLYQLCARCCHCQLTLRRSSKEQGEETIKVPQVGRQNKKSHLGGNVGPVRVVRSFFFDVDDELTTRSSETRWRLNIV